MLKVISIPSHTEEKNSAHQYNTNVPPRFISNVWSQDPRSYLMVAQDHSHNLSCELILEVERDQDKYGEEAVICHFPRIIDLQLKYLINHDDTLYEIIMVQFQMKILEQLFTFCASQCVSKLIIYTSGTQVDELEIYREFLIYMGQIPPSNDNQTEISIIADTQTFESWINFMNKVTSMFRQMLWQDHRMNATIRQYLKKHPLG